MSTFFQLYTLVLDSDPDEFEVAIPFGLPGEATFLDVQHPQNEAKDTLLCHAVRHGKIEHVEVLIRHGANPTVVNGMGSTPMAIAKAIKNLQLFNTLKEATKNYQPVEKDGALAVAGDPRLVTGSTITIVL